MAEGAGSRQELDALEGLVRSAGWAFLLERMALSVLHAQEALEQQRMGEVEHAIQATVIRTLKDIQVWPQERAEFLREKLRIGGE